MKQLLLASSLLLSMAIARPVLAQVNYYDHPHYPYEDHGIETTNCASVSLRNPNSYLNGRQGPGTNYRIIASFWHSNPVKVFKSSRQSSHTWYLVGPATASCESSGAHAWVRGDYLRF